MATAAQIASPGVYVTDDVGVEVTDGQSSRVQLGLLPTGTYGLRVVTAGGSTVIIDGTSDMFKIAATGTIALNLTAGGIDLTASVTLTGLGTYTTCPAVLYNVTANAASQTSNRYAGQSRLAKSDFVAPSSGGSPTVQIPDVSVSLNASAALTGSSSGNVAVSVWGTNTDVVTFGDVGARYWVLQETAL